MKQLITLILTLFTLSGCQVKSGDKQAQEESTSDELIENSMEKQTITTNFIKDSADYSMSFLNKMEQRGMKNVSLVDSFLILSSKDTVTFPQEPEIGKRMVLTAKKGELAIALTITRINQTTIDYKLEMVEFGNASFYQKGQAHLSPSFYLGSETDESSYSGISYLSNLFSDNQDSCYTYIRLGRDADTGDYLLGKLIKNCNGKLRNLGHDNYPTLIEK